MCSQLHDCLRWGGASTRPHHPAGLREAGCDLVFLMVLSLVLMGCGDALPPHWNGVVWGIGST